MKCTDCKYCVLQEYGWSNWTVEGKEADCLLGKNPDFPADNFYTEATELKYAEKCSCFCKGTPVDIDVEREDGFPEGYSDDPYIIVLLVNWNENS
jgi:hypothetical protein